MIRNLLLVASLAPVLGFAQLNSAEHAPTFIGETNSTGNEATSEESGDRAFWTIQLDVDVLTVNTGLAACFWTGTEFWVAKWSNDTLHTLNAAGVETSAFVVPGVTGTRSITSDGTHIYLGANTPSIFKVDPTTKTLTSTITTSVPNCRWLTYDPTLDAGAGGFWTGSWATDITSVSMTGTTLTTLPAANHALTTIYGMAYDGVSPSGPYLWAFEQTAAGTGANIVQLSMTGTPTGLSHNTQTDLTGAPNTGLAGGLFVADDFVVGKNTIGGISQGESIFAYELADLAGTEEMENGSFSVYPNPVTDVLTITTSAVSVELISIYSANGQLIMTTNENSKTIDVSMLTPGVYFIQVQSENGISTERFVKN